VNARSALLSNFEVLRLLKELENQHLASTKTAIRIKKEDEEAGRPASNYVSAEQVSENLRTVEVEVCFPIESLRSSAEHPLGNPVLDGTVAASIHAD
jgi:predicted ArsR family transcriptional regulator